VGLLEKEAGILFPEDCIRAFLAAAKGATIHYNEEILQIHPMADKIEVTTTAGKYIVEQLILTVGAWTGRLLPALSLPLTIARQTLHWFTDISAKTQPRFLPGNMPVYIWEYAPDRMFYGFPDLGTGIKIAWHHNGSPIDPDRLTQEVSTGEIEEIKEMAARYLDITPVYNRSAVCMYTNTPDGNFIIDFHPEYRNIIIGSPCSGHGFKFSSLTGKILGDMATGNDHGFDLSSFAIRPT
jgi:glycine/D-amino acid oxidase-like deaminating enzyme